MYIYIYLHIHIHMNIYSYPRIPSNHIADFWQCSTSLERDLRTGTRFTGNWASTVHMCMYMQMYVCMYVYAYIYMVGCNSCGFCCGPPSNRAPQASGAQKQALI